jgi:hypothetical protein
MVIGMTTAALPILLQVGGQMDPITQAILAQVGGQIVGSLFESISGPSAGEQAIGQQLGIGQTLIPQLQAQAAGRPTAATQAQMGQLRQQGTRMQQSYAASAQRQGIAGTTPARAQQGRLQAATLQGMAGVLGQAQVSAQQQLGGLYGQGLSYQRQVEAQRAGGQQQLAGSIASIMANREELRAIEAESVGDKEILAAFFNMMLGVSGQGGTPGGIAPQPKETFAPGWQPQWGTPTT